MRLYITDNKFISVIRKENGFSCQIMELVYGIGFYPARFEDRNSQEVVSCIDTSHPCMFFQTFDEVCQYHEKSLASEFVHS